MDNIHHSDPISIVWLPPTLVPCDPQKKPEPPTIGKLLAIPRKTVSKSGEEVISKLLRELLHYRPDTLPITSYSHPDACTDFTPEVTGEAPKEEILAAARKETSDAVRDEDLMNAALHALKRASNLGKAHGYRWLEEHHLPRKTDSIYRKLLRVMVFCKPGENVQISFVWPFQKRIDCGTKSVPELVEKLSKPIEKPSLPDGAAPETASLPAKIALSEPSLDPRNFCEPSLDPRNFCGPSLDPRNFCGPLLWIDPSEESAEHASKEVV